MATHNLEFGATTGLTLTAKAIIPGTFTTIATATSVTEQTLDAVTTGRYHARFTTLSASAETDYLLIYFSSGVATGYERYRVPVTAGTIQPYSDLALLLAELDAVTAIATPATSRAIGTTLRAYVGETITFPALPPRDVDGTVLDTTAITLVVTIESLDGTDIVTVADGAITKTATTIQFTGSSTANANVSQKRWSARRTGNSVVVAGGPYVVEYAP